MARRAGSSVAPEVEALGVVLAALTKLDDKLRPWVIASAVSNLNIPMAATAAAGVGSAAGAGAAANTGADASNVAGTPGTKEHAKNFLRAKKPANDVQRVGVLAYYLSNHKGTPLFKTKELTEMNNEAAGTAIGNMSQAVDNATKAHYLAAAGGAKKRLSSFGEAIVDALPDQQKVLQVNAEQRPKRRKPRKAKKAV